MRIWLVHQHALPPSEFGSTRHYTFARELIRHGHEVVIIASGVHYAIRKEKALAAGERWRHEVIEGVPFCWVRSPEFSENRLIRLWNMTAFAARLWAGTGVGKLAKPDIILGSSPSLFAALAAERLAKRFRVPFVLEVRDIWPQTVIDLGRVSERHPIICAMRWIERHLYAKADHIVTVLPKAQDYMVEKGVPPDKISWLPNGTDFRMVPEPERAGEDGILTVMYTGAHGLANGLGLMLDTAALLEREGYGDRVRFSLVGDGPEKPVLQERARKENLANVQFADPVPKREICRKLLEADVCVEIQMDTSLYQWGTSPNKVFDYLAAARPILFCGREPLTSVTEAQAGICVRPENPRAMADAVKQFIEMPDDERWEMGLRGRRYVEEHHDFARLTDRLADILREVAARPRG